MRDQGVCEGTASGRDLPVRFLSMSTGLALLLPDLIETLTGGPPRFHAVGPNPTDVDQFSFIVLLLSLVQVLNTTEADHSLPPDKVTFVNILCIISAHNRLSRRRKRDAASPAAHSRDDQEKPIIIG